MNDFDWDEHSRRVLEGFTEEQRAIYDALERRGFEPIASGLAPGESASRATLAFLSHRFVQPQRFFLDSFMSWVGRDKLRDHQKIMNRWRKAQGKDPEPLLPVYDDSVYRERQKVLTIYQQIELNELCASLGLPPYADVDLDDDDSIRNFVIREGEDLRDRLSRQAADEHSGDGEEE